MGLSAPRVAIVIIRIPPSWTGRSAVRQAGRHGSNPGQSSGAGTDVPPGPTEGAVSSARKTGPIKWRSASQSSTMGRPPVRLRLGILPTGVGCGREVSRIVQVTLSPRPAQRCDSCLGILRRLLASWPNWARSSISTRIKSGKPATAMRSEVAIGNRWSQSGAVFEESSRRLRNQAQCLPLVLAMRP